MSVYEIINDWNVRGEHDTTAIRFNATRERWGYITQSENLLEQAAMSRANGESAANNALFGGFMNFGQGLAGMYYNNMGSSPLTQQNNYPSWVNTFGPEHYRRNGRRY